MIAASDSAGLLAETYPLNSEGCERGFYLDDDRLVSYARTPGYETYRGLGWLGVVEHRLVQARAAPIVPQRRYAAL